MQSSLLAPSATTTPNCTVRAQHLEENTDFCQAHQVPNRPEGQTKASWWWGHLKLASLSECPTFIQWFRVKFYQDILWALPLHSPPRGSDADSDQPLSTHYFTLCKSQPCYSRGWWAIWSKITSSFSTHLSVKCSWCIFLDFQTLWFSDSPSLLFPSVAQKWTFFPDACSSSRNNHLPRVIKQLYLIIEVKALCMISAEVFSVEQINLFTALWNSLRKQDHTMYTASI